MAAGFRRLVANMKSDADLSTIADLLEGGRIEEALIETLRRTPALGTLYSQAFMAAAKDTAEFLNRNLEFLIVNFDQTNPFAVQVMRENQLRMVQQYTQAQARATREALLEGIRRGANPIEQARNFRNSIGLTEHQVKAVNNYERLLSEGDRQVFNRALRDKRFDSAVHRAIEEGRPLTRTQINRMVDRYRQRFIDFRANTIARTESLASVHQGSMNMYQQAIEAGLDPNGLSNEWNTALDERVRGSHSTMHGQVVKFGEVFVSGEGNTTLMPGGFGVASEDIQCRCAVGTRITEVAPVPGLTVEFL
jgi:uncharacterized protein with gpF-like domain